MYSFESRVRFSELDSEGYLSLPALLDYFQDCSTFQSEDLGLGIAYMAELKQIWALSSWQIIVKRYPRIGDRIRICTLPYEFKGFIGFRNFWMEDMEGNQLAVANSVWSLIDMESGRPCRANEKMLEAYKIEPKLEMEYADRKVKLPVEGMKEENIHIGKQHLDTNHHVNNGQYIKIAMSYLPQNFVIRQMRAEYKMQSHLGDEMIPVLSGADGEFGVSLRNVQNEIYCNIQFLSE